MTDQIGGHVELTTDGAVGIVTFSNPPSNYFNLQLLGRIAEAFEAADADDDVRAIVLGSEGRVFCAGAELGGSNKVDQAAIYAEGLRLFGVRKPVVAAVQGAAIGGGLGLALVADFRVVSRESRFAANFVKIGVHPGFGLTLTLPRLVGDHAAANIFLTGRRVGGEEAVDLGLADMIVEPNDVRGRAIEFAAELAEGAPLAVEATRATLRAGFLEALALRMEVEVDEQQRLFATEDFKEGVQAVSERRAGRWKRR